MAVKRSQSLICGMGFHRQSALGAMVADADLWNLRLGEYRAPIPILGRTTDAEFFGKGHPHATQSIKLGKDSQFELPFPFLTSQNWAQAVVFGGMDFTESPNGSGAYQYTAHLLTESGDVDAIMTTLVGQLEAGAALDSALLDMVCTGWTLRLQRGADLANATLVLRWAGTGRHNGASGLTIPAAYTEHRLSTGMLATLTINGTNFLSPDRFQDLEVTLENDIDLDGGYGPGGSQDGYDVRTRMRVRNQRISMVWTSEVEDTSEFDDFQDGVEGETILQITGPAIGGGAFHTARIRMPRSIHQALEPVDANGWASQRITTEPLMDSSEGLVELIAITDKAGIGTSA